MLPSQQPEGAPRVVCASQEGSDDRILPVRIGGAVLCTVSVVASASACLGCSLNGVGCDIYTVVLRTTEMVHPRTSPRTRGPVVDSDRFVELYPKPELIEFDHFCSQGPLSPTSTGFGGGRDTDSIPNSGFDAREDETDRDGAGQ